MSAAMRKRSSAMTLIGVPGRSLSLGGESRSDSLSGREVGWGERSAISSFPQDYGPKVNFKHQKVKLGSFNGLPPFSKPLIERMHQSVPELCHFVPVELCTLEYSPKRGSAIDPHLDDEWLWGERLVTLNLLSSTILTFSNPPLTVEVLVPLPRRALTVVSGPARHMWLHSIQRQHIVSRRVGITMRELSCDFLPGGKEEEMGKQVLEIAMDFQGQPINFRK